MAVLRREATKIVLTDSSPYGSRTLTVESDGVTTAAYLKDPQGGVAGAAWVANHRQAPNSLDLGRLNAGQQPTMPAGQTRHPQGRPKLDPRTLQVVWFEEGDGAALLENGEPLAVIPAWADMDRGIPGYSRDALVQGPFAFPFEAELAEFRQRIHQSQSFWAWRADPESWAGFQQSALGHLMRKLGPGGHYWHDVGQQWRGSGAAPAPSVGVSERPSRPDRPYSVLSTLGMSCQRMPTVEVYEEDVSAFARIELAVASTLPSQQVGSIFPWLAQYPWRSVTWFAPGDVIRWYHDAGTFPLNSAATRWEGVLLLDDPARLGGPTAADLSGFSFGGDPVRWLWMVPITDRERQLAKAHGSDVLIEQLAVEGRSWIAT